MCWEESGTDFLQKGKREGFAMEFSARQWGSQLGILAQRSGNPSRQLDKETGKLEVGKSRKVVNGTAQEGGAGYFNVQSLTELASPH
jgi:hypothetical protein